MLQAVTLLERLLGAAEAGERMGSVIDILVLQALAREARDDIAGAIEPLSRALALAEPEGFVRTFVDEGAPMRRLLAEAVRRGVRPDYPRRLLAEFDASGSPSERPHRRAAASPAPPLAEPLSDREIDVLQLIIEGLSNREIADRLFLALDTVKGHNRRLFAKLGVQRRTEAIARAHELDLL